MFLLRIGLLAFVVLMFVPRGPEDRDTGFIGFGGKGSHFCDRYPKTCDASGELSTAFRQKFSYAITLVRQLIAPQSGGTQLSRRGDDDLAFDSRSRGVQSPVGEWRPRGQWPNASGTDTSGRLSPDDRSRAWRGD